MSAPAPTQVAFLHALTTSLFQWLQATPRFASHPGAASLHQHLAALHMAGHVSAALIADLQTDLLRLQGAFHEARHAAATYALTSETYVWDLHLWFAPDLNPDPAVDEGHVGRAYVMERLDWPHTRPEVRAELATVLAGVLFHPRIRGVHFTGGEACDEVPALALADRWGWSLDQAYADAWQQLDRPEVHAAETAVADEAFGRLAVEQSEVAASTTAQILGEQLQRSVP